MDVTIDDRISLESLLRRDGYDGSVSARAQIVLWRAEGHPIREITRMAGTTKPTVYKWIARYAQYGIDGLSDHVSTGRPPEVSVQVRATIFDSPVAAGKTGLSHWSSRKMARYLKQETGICASHNVVAALWREHYLQQDSFARCTLLASAQPPYLGAGTGTVWVRSATIRLVTLCG